MEDGFTGRVRYFDLSITAGIMVTGAGGR